MNRYRFQKPDIYLLIQLILFFIAIGFSSGGGNMPGTQSNDLIYLKATLLSTPLFSAIVLFLLNPHFVGKRLRNLFSLHKNYFYYILCSIVFIPFAVVWQYSALRLFYMTASFISLFSLLLQYYVRYADKEHATLVIRKTLTILAISSLVLPVYVLIQFGTDDFRTSLQSMNLIHPNVLCSFYAHLLIFFGYQFVYEKNKIMPFIMMLIFGILVLALFSRSTMMGLFLCSLVISPIIYLRSKSIIPLIYLFSAILVFSVLSILVISNILPLESLLSVIARNNDIESLYTFTNRSLLWNTLLNEVDTKTLLIGNGYSVIDKDFGVNFGTATLYGAHNAYLSILLGSGIFALLFFVKYITRIFAVIFKLAIPKSIFYAIAASIIFFTINCFFSEEVGVSLTVPFAYLVFLSTLGLVLYPKAKS